MWTAGCELGTGVSVSGSPVDDAAELHGCGSGGSLAWGWGGLAGLRLRALRRSRGACAAGWGGAA